MLLKSDTYLRYNFILFKYTFSTSKRVHFFLLYDLFKFIAFLEKISGPITFGDSVVLRCYVSEDICDPVIRKAWGIGPSNRVICSNGQSYVKNKYKMISNNISGNYDLEIFKFNETDMVNVYTYSCGAKRFSKVLIPNNYICKYTIIDIFFYDLIE